jgi:hypothetical protein
MPQAVDAEHLLQKVGPSASLITMPTWVKLAIDGRGGYSPCKGYSYCFTAMAEISIFAPPIKPAT